VSAPCRCQTARDTARRPASRRRRIGEILGWIFPTTALALIPKCPACVAAYVALATGIGISVPAATHLRTSMVFVCAASLVLLAARRIKRIGNSTATAEI
jgi:hypothetical protein